MGKDFRIFESELVAIAYEASLHNNKETGGDLFGLWSASGNPVVFLATGPGPNARGHIAEYEIDTEYMAKCEELLLENFGIHYLGDWHSHHNLGCTRPSSGDQQRIQKICRRLSRINMCEIIITHVSERGFKERISTYVYSNGSLNDGDTDVLKTRISPIRKALTESTTYRGIVNLINGQLPIGSLLLSVQNERAISNVRYNNKSIRISLER